MLRHVIAGVVLATLAVGAPVHAQVILGPVVTPRAVKEVAPQYPQAAARANIHDQVWLSVAVDAQGRLGRIDVTKASADAVKYGLVQAAIAALRQWEFEPATTMGAPIALNANVIFDFPPRGPSAVRFEDTLDGRVTLPPPFADATPLETEGLAPPTLLYQAQPRYTSEALRARISGDVLADIVVAADGTVAAARVVKSLDPGLDAQALDAVSQWRFTSGRLLGKLVPVRMTVSVAFRTRPR